MAVSPITVCVRTRPASVIARELTVDPEAKTIDIVSKIKDKKKDSVDNSQKSWSFKYDQVIHMATQETVYQGYCATVVDSVLDGKNGAIIAYGQTGAGKTFTMIGNTRNFLQRGVAPRTFAQIMSAIETRTGHDIVVKCSYLEIYNGRIFDLLDDVDNENQTYDFAIVDTKNEGTVVRGLRCEEVKCEEDCLNLLFKGEMSRTTARHQLNKRSNRSHCVFTIHIEQRSKIGNGEVKRSKLHLVDLAGSERLKKTMGPHAPSNAAEATTSKESMSINKSLSYLEQCVVALTSKSRTHIPYRQSKLTNVLKDALGGNCKTVLLACIWSESRHLEETVSTLQFAQRMMKVKNSVKINVEQDPNMQLKKYERQIKELKQELIMHDALSNRTGVVYGEFSSEQKSEIGKAVKIYLDAPPNTKEEASAIEVNSLKQIQEIFRAFKSLHLAQRQEIARLRSAKSYSPKEVPTKALGRPAEQLAPSNAVGEMTNEGGVALGVAPEELRPASMNQYLKEARERKKSKAVTQSITDTTALEPHADRPVRALSKADAYERYRVQDGKELNDQILETNAVLRRLKNQLRQAQTRINTTQQHIRRTSALIAEKKRDRVDNPREGGEDVIDEEEFTLLREERDHKRNYRETMKLITDIKTRLQEKKQFVLKIKARLLDNFDDWFVANHPSTPDDTDKLDFGEWFDEMETKRVMDDDPESLPFFKAKKNMATTKRLTANQRSHNLKAKRYGGQR